ncbi:MAG: hypothetical protein M0P73_17955 [Syntrophobacterales bacterium]|jgi:hypothetical protein|nr:hypothetical protein [Syntrophobacterales bacterium]
MRTGLMLLALIALLTAACADTNGSSRYRGGSSMINWAADCATCGAAIKDDYFAGSAYKAMGPGSY